MPSYKLTYFNLRGRAEVARMLFALAGVEYTDERIAKESWMEFKKTTPFGQMPLLQTEGVVLCQSDVISAYLAKQFGYAGETDLEGAQIAMILACCNDILVPVIRRLSAPAEQKDEMKTKFEKEQLPVFLSNLEKMLVSNNGGDGFFVGSKVSYAELKLETALDFSACQGMNVDMTVCPKIAALRERVKNLPRIREWIAKRPVTSI